MCVSIRLEEQDLRGGLDSGFHMSMRGIFAKNLEKLSSAHKSHAQVARDLGVNRQQFDNYVKGKNLPNERIIEKICTHFQVDLGSLFRDYDHESANVGTRSLIDKHRNKLDAIVGSELASRGSGLVDGLYYIFFSIPDDGDTFACSLLAVRREGGLTTFKRITRLGGMAGPLRSMAKDIHSGIVVYRDGSVFLAGIDTTNGRYPSLLVAVPVASLEVLFSGESLISTGPAFQNTKFCITPISKRTGVWKAMRRVSIMSGPDLLRFSPKIYSYFQRKNNN